MTVLLKKVTGFCLPETLENTIPSHLETCLPFSKYFGLTATIMSASIFTPRFFIVLSFLVRESYSYSTCPIRESRLG